MTIQPIETTPLLDKPLDQPYNEEQRFQLIDKQAKKYSYHKDKIILYRNWRVSLIASTIILLTASIISLGNRWFTGGGCAMGGSYTTSIISYVCWRRQRHHKKEANKIKLHKKIKEIYSQNV